MEARLCTQLWATPGNLKPATHYIQGFVDLLHSRFLLLTFFFSLVNRACNALMILRLALACPSNLSSFISCVFGSEIVSVAIVVIKMTGVSSGCLLNPRLLSDPGTGVYQEATFLSETRPDSLIAATADPTLLEPQIDMIKFNEVHSQP